MIAKHAHAEVLYQNTRPCASSDTRARQGAGTHARRAGARTPTLVGARAPVLARFAPGRGRACCAEVPAHWRRGLARGSSAQRWKPGCRRSIWAPVAVKYAHPVSCTGADAHARVFARHARGRGGVQQALCGAAAPPAHTGTHSTPDARRQQERRRPVAGGPSARMCASPRPLSRPPARTPPVSVPGAAPHGRRRGRRPRTLARRLQPLLVGLISAKGQCIPAPGFQVVAQSKLQRVDGQPGMVRGVHPRKKKANSWWFGKTRAQGTWTEGVAADAAWTAAKRRRRRRTANACTTAGC